MSQLARDVKTELDNRDEKNSGNTEYASRQH
ncbi:Uncharacterised protein [Escherichia coli]|uniref:Uncharacterized protein n=1 Tax=Escherichia coli TaxID=562 RepID=A0A377A123_ECOLX|nr:Uncharacterised protein [Escherichia coli]